MVKSIITLLLVSLLVSCGTLKDVDTKKMSDAAIKKALAEQQINDPPLPSFCTSLFSDVEVKEGDKYRWIIERYRAKIKSINKERQLCKLYDDQKRENYKTVKGLY